MKWKRDLIGYQIMLRVVSLKGQDARCLSEGCKVLILASFGYRQYLAIKVSFMVACKEINGPYFSVRVRMMSLYISRMISLYQKKKVEPCPDYPGLVSLEGGGGGGGEVGGTSRNCIQISTRIKSKFGHAQ